MKRIIILVMVLALVGCSTAAQEDAIATGIAQTQAAMPTNTLEPTDTPLPPPTDTPEPTPTDTPEPTDTEIPLPTETKEPTEPPINADAIAGFWTGKTAGTEGGRPLRTLDTEVVITPGCSIGDLCGKFINEDGCTYDIFFKEVKDNIFIFVAENKGYEFFCVAGTFGTLEMAFRPGGTISLAFEIIGVTGELVTRSGILTKEE